MTIKPELILFVMTLCSSAAGVLVFVWKIGNAVAAMKAELRSQVTTMKAELQSQVTAADFDRKFNDERLEHLQDTLKLGLNGLKEKFEHYSTRARGEASELSKRVESVENFLVKSTEFEKR